MPVGSTSEPRDARPSPAPVELEVAAQEMDLVTENSHRDVHAAQAFSMGVTRAN